ncbi:MAG: imidazole glycerol phosphate synthase subunit HisH [Candidatus Limnocylindria bacterium]
MIAIVDYGVGNLASVRKAFAAVGARAELVARPERLAQADALVLPGVGHFGHCARELRRRGLHEPVAHAVERGTPLLAICVGLQLLFEGSAEDDRERGLGILPGRVVRMSEAPRLPQIGWNSVSLVGRHPWLQGTADEDYFYFVHSYVPVADDERVVLGTTEYAGSRVAIAGRDGVLGVQFHPEKSSLAGLRLLRAFAASVPSRGRAARA